MFRFSQSGMYFVQDRIAYHLLSSLHLVKARADLVQTNLFTRNPGTCKAASEEVGTRHQRLQLRPTTKNSLWSGHTVFLSRHQASPSEEKRFAHCHASLRSLKTVTYYPCVLFSAENIKLIYKVDEICLIGRQKMTKELLSTYDLQSGINKCPFFRQHSSRPW